MKSNDSKRADNLNTTIWKVLQDKMPPEISSLFPKKWILVIGFLLLLLIIYQCNKSPQDVLRVNSVDCESTINEKLAKLELDRQLGRSAGSSEGSQTFSGEIGQLFESEVTWVFRAKTRGYNFSRIPALVYHRNVFYAFCEGRKDGAADWGQMDIIYRKGYRHGAEMTWSNVKVAIRVPNMRVMNPCPIVDLKRNALVLVFTAIPTDMKEHEQLIMGQYTTQLYVTKTLDGGRTWSTPIEITASTVGTVYPTPSTYAPGPGHGIQLKSGTLVVALHYLQKDYTHSRYYSNSDYAGVIYSGDGGDTWRSGAPNPPAQDAYGHAINANEAQVVELNPDVLALNTRTLDVLQTRMTAFSVDGGRTFPHVFLSPDLIEPGFKYKPGRSRLTSSKFGGCEGSVLAFPRPERSELWQQPRAVLFSNPASMFREKMSVRLSTDGLVHWSRAWTIHHGPSAYSDLTSFTVQDPRTNRTIQAFAILFEGGTIYAYEGIKFKFFTLDTLLHNMGHSLEDTPFLNL